MPRDEELDWGVTLLDELEAVGSSVDMMNAFLLE